MQQKLFSRMILQCELDRRKLLPIETQENVMTRLNIIPPEELNNKMLAGEWHEICRVFTLVRNLKSRGINKYNFHKKVKQPDEWTLGTGHVLYFYTRLGFVANRVEALYEEMCKRGFKPTKISRGELLKDIDTFYQGDYVPTPKALLENRERIAKRLSGDKS
jgi:deoxyribonuclease (pyrimidine dimer)